MRPRKAGETGKRFTKFGAVGVLNTAVDAGLFFLLVRYARIPWLPASAASYTAGVLNSYLWNSLWTFRAGITFRPSRSAKFIAVNLCSLAVSTAVLYLLRSPARLPLAAAKAGSIAVSLAVNYMGNALWVFRSRPGNRTPHPGDTQG